MVAPDQTDFFVSRNGNDRAWAEWVAWQLEDAGYSTVLQDWDFRPGNNFVLKMQEASTNCERTLAILSPHYLAAEFTQPEWAAAFVDDPRGTEGTLLMVRVRDCTPPGLLKAVVYIDFVGLEEDKATKALLQGIQRSRAKPAVRPAFPGAPAKRIAQKPHFPGSLPAICNVPHLRNPNFTGRADLLIDLRDALTSGQTMALTQSIHGLGGVGKTQLATEYCYRHAGDYQVIWWVRSEDLTTLAADFAALSVRQGLVPAEEANQQVAIEATRSWFEQNADALVIFDNAASREAVRDYLPRTGGTHIVITSRNPNWSGIASALPVHAWDRTESVGFILARTASDDRASAESIAEELGNLPLALEQAASFIEETASSLAHYLETFRERRSELMRRGKPSTDYGYDVATTWEISFGKAEEECAAAADLLNLCAFLAPDDIPLDVIRAGAEHLPERLAAAAEDALLFDQAVAALRRYSLVEKAGDALSVHRLVQVMTCDRMTEDARKRWTEAAVQLLNAAFPSDISTNPKNWPLCARLLAHALAITESAEKLRVAPEATDVLLNQLGTYLRVRAQFADARSAFERAIRVAESFYGPDHPEVAMNICNLGSVLQDQGDLAGARAAIESALRIGEQAYGPEHRIVTSFLNNLGLVLKDQGDLDGARAAFERVLHINEQAYGPDHPNVAACVNNLGSVLRDQGDLPGARAAFERVLRIAEQAYGPEHLHVATSVNNLGMVLRDQGALADARAAFERALRIDERAYGPNHPVVATGVNNLGLVLQAEGDLAGAQAAYERALGIFRRFLGDEHPKTVTVRNNLESLG